MIATHVSVLDRTVHLTNAWLDELTAQGPFEARQDAYNGFRAVLHALRDRITPQEAVHLASQLPMLVRGLYYEGWRPALAPDADRREEDFLGRVALRLRGGGRVEDARRVTGSVFHFLEEKISKGEIDDVKSQLPPSIRRLFDA